MLKKLNQLKVVISVLGLLLFMVLPAIAQQPLSEKQLPTMQQQQTDSKAQSKVKMIQKQSVNPELLSTEKMVQQMKQMMTKSSTLMQQMKGHQGKIMHGDQNWTDMMHGSDNVVKNMNQVIERMHNMMNNEKMMNNPKMKQHLETMKKNMSGIIESMNGFLENAEEAQKI